MSREKPPVKFKDAGELSAVPEADGKRGAIAPRVDFGKRWHRFRVLAPNLLILRGSRAMSDPRFKYRSRGRQAAPCSVVAIVYGRLFQPKEWTQGHVDQVLEHGDKLFRLSAAKNRVRDDEYMRTGLVRNEFYVGFYKVLVGIEDSVHGNLFSESIGCSDLAEGLRRFLRDNDSGVITAQGSSVGVWRQSPNVGTSFLYYDPASCDETGTRRPGGTACLMRFKCLDDLHTHFVKNLDRRYDSRYCIDKVAILRVTEVGRGFVDRLLDIAGPPVVQRSVLRSINPADVDDNHKVDCTKPVPKDVKLRAPAARIRKEPLSITISNYSIDRRFATEPLVNRNEFDTGYSYDAVRANVPSTFRELPGKLAILRGTTHEGSDVYKGAGAQNVANCLMAIAVRRAHPVKTWTRPKLDEILALGDSVHAVVKSEKPATATLTAADFNDARLRVEDLRLLVDVDVVTVTGTINSKVPSVLNLKQALEEFFLVNEQGVLETSSMAVAIWSENDCYYMFDPRACNAAGVRVREEVVEGGRGDRKAEIEQEAGYCCVIRFPNVDSMVALLLRNVDPARKNDRFVIRSVVIVDDVPGIRPWNEFQPGAAGKTWVLRGGISNVDELFEEENQGRQGLAMSLVGLVNAWETPPERWNRETVDETVREGDAYYTWCKPAEAEEEVEEEPLRVQHLKKRVYFKNRKVTVDLEEAAIVGNLTAPDDSELPNLEKGLRQFFERKRYGIVEAKRLAVAVWKVEEEVKDEDTETRTFYYCFDPNPRDSLGELSEKEEENFACVVRTSDLAALADLIGKNAGRDDEEYGNDFAIHELRSVTVGTTMTEEEIEADKRIPIMPELNNYSRLGDNGALLLGSVTQGNETLFKWQTRDKQQAANALTALAMSKLHNPHLWSRDLVDDILKIGDRLAVANLINLPEAEAEEEAPRNYLLPSEISEDFTIGVNRMMVGLEEEAGGGKTTEMTRLLEQFFEGNSMGVFRQDDVMVPIWKEGDVFFTMNPKGRDVHGDTGDKDKAAAVMWFTNVSSLADVLREIARDTDFAIDAVTIENVYETRVEEAQRIKRTTSGEDLWHHFPKLADGVWSIDGNVAMTDERFDETNRGKQSAAVAAMAVVFSKVYQPKYWTPSVLDEVIVTGDKLHSKCVERLGSDAAPLMSEIINEFFLSTRRIALTLRDCVQAGGLNGKPPRVQDLRSGIDKFFQKHDAGALTARRNNNVAIWRAGNACYALIPNWSVIAGDTASTVPRLFRFRDTTLLAEYLLRHFGSGGDYQITAIDVLDSSRVPPEKLDPSPAIRPANLPPLNAYKKLRGEARAILRGGYHQGDNVFPETLRGRQTAANCVVAHAMSVVKCPATWTRRTMDEILAIGSGVYQETRKARPTASRPKPEDIIRIFCVGTNVLTADIEPSTVSGSLTISLHEPEQERGKGREETAPRSQSPAISLADSLRTFFQNNRAGILVIGRSMIAIWKDLGVYFMYDPRAKNDQGLPDSDGTSCVMWFACIEPLHDVILANIDPREKQGNFRICRVIVRTVVLEPLPCPVGFQSYQECTASPASTIVPRTIATFDVKPLHEYSAVDEEVSVLRGTVHMGHRAFRLRNRGLQSTAIAAVAVVVGLLHVPSKWTPEIIDAVLKHGDSLYSDSAKVARPGARNLSPSELLTVFVVGDARATVHVHNHTAAGVLNSCDLLESLSMFFRANCAGILHTANMAMAVMQSYGKFYMLDPRSRDDRGGPNFDGAACVFKCDTVARMAEIFVANYNLKRPKVYTLNAVNVLNLHFFSDARSSCLSKCNQ